MGTIFGLARAIMDNFVPNMTFRCINMKMTSDLHEIAGIEDTGSLPVVKMHFLFFQTIMANSSSLFAGSLQKHGLGT